ncbi:MAG TPA: hypothetical protein VN577_12400 [Terriglobales bacterium]|nr:hypothetical protein [Terriglobales bacterium]
MRVRLNPGTIKKFGRTAWRYQRTYQIPAGKNVARFASAIIQALEEARDANLTVDNLVFEPEHLKTLIGSNEMHLEHDVTIEVEGRDALIQVLEAAMKDIGDFLFVPRPKRFVLYADRNQRATFFSQSAASLNKMSEFLSNEGFQELPVRRRAQHPEAVERR